MQHNQSLDPTQESDVALRGKTLIGTAQRKRYVF